MNISNSTEEENRISKNDKYIQYCKIIEMNGIFSEILSYLFIYMMCMPCFVGEGTISIERSEGSVNGGPSFQYREFKCIKQGGKKQLF